MLDLFAQSMFEATRVSPVFNAATAKDWRSSSDNVCIKGFLKCGKEHGTLTINRSKRNLAAFARLHRICAG